MDKLVIQHRLTFKLSREKRTRTITDFRVKKCAVSSYKQASQGALKA